MVDNTERPAGFGENYIATNRFYIEMASELTASFSECSGLDVQVDKDVYFEGGVNEQQRVFLKQAKFGDITLKRGLSDDFTFWDWLNKLLSEGKAERRNINILLFNQAGETIQAWSLHGAVPVGWRSPTLQASSNAVAIEELTLAYEGLSIKNSGGGGITASLQRDAAGYFSSAR
ncbi:MAG: phage tail protein [Cyanobacteria bacterium J06560_6]